MQIGHLKYQTRGEFSSAKMKNSMRLVTSSSFFFFFLLASLFVAISAYRREPDSWFSCLSWRLGVETNNIRGWGTVPKVCGDYVADYITGGQYLKDSRAVTHQAFGYSKSLDLEGNGKDIWIFDVDETALSHVPFLAQYGYGVETFDPIAFLEYLNEGISPALPASLTLYRRLMDVGINIVFMTGRLEFMRNSTETNLMNVGYYTWEKLILRDSSNWNLTQTEYKTAKRRELVESGYRIVGNIGDQWSDLLGNFPGNRTFKLPNPMYYAE